LRAAHSHPGEPAQIPRRPWRLGVEEQEQQTIAALSHELYSDTLQLLQEYRGTLLRIRNRLLQNSTLDKDLFELLAPECPIPVIDAPAARLLEKRQPLNLTVE
jgi:hypothetical protein